MTPNRTTVQKVDHHKNKLFVNRMFEYEIPDDTKKQAEQILNTYLKRARLALRILGGSADYPLVTADHAAQSKRFVSYEEGVLKPFHEVWRSFPENKKPVAVHDIIMPCKVDVNSLTLAIGMVRHGDQKWGNVANRFRKFYKADLLFALMEGATLEDS